MIDESHIQQFEKDGAICVRNAVAPAQLRQVLHHLDELIGSESDRWTTNRIGGFSDRHLWPHMNWMRDFCTRTALPEVAALAMRSATARLFFDHTFIRDPMTEHSTPWHQDRPYWPFQGQQIVSIWVALTDSTPQTSGLRFVKGSHRWGKTFRPTPFGQESASAKFIGGNDASESMPDFDSHPQEFTFLEWDMDAGDAIVFGAEVIHGSAPNNHQSHRRAAISVRYVGDDARWDPRPGTDPIVTQDQVSVSPGDPPHDDRWFPQVWRRS